MPHSLQVSLPGSGMTMTKQEKFMRKEKPQNFLRHFKSIWVGLDCFNLFDISNVSSYYWVTDVNDIQYAVPNYLTRRQLNVRLSVNF